MNQYNAKNERIKRQYLTFLRQAKLQSEASVDAVAAALSRFEGYTRHKDFKVFNHQQATAFKRHLADQAGSASDGKLSQATQYAILAHLKRFFQWLAGQPGYRSTVQYSDAEYFNLPGKEARIATARRARPAPTLEQVQHVIRQMPTQDDIQRRNRALLAFILLTGARDRAVASMKLKHVDLATNRLYQDARDVKTKFSKTFSTYFFQVGDGIREIVVDWIDYLQSELLWGGDDPLFPRTHVVVGSDSRFATAGLERAHWSDASPIRKIFREAFAAADLPYFNPHSLRSTLVGLGQRVCRNPEEFKAWSQNLGHEGVMTTLTSYGHVSEGRQAEIIHGLIANTNAESRITKDDVIRLLQKMTG